MFVRGQFFASSFEDSPERSQGKVSRLRVKDMSEQGSVDRHPSSGLLKEIAEVTAVTEEQGTFDGLQEEAMPHSDDTA